MSVRAKFKVNKIGRQAVGAGQELVTVEMCPVFSEHPGHENKRFWNATPSGSIEIGCANPSVADSFELGGEYYVDFSPAESTKGNASIYGSTSPRSLVAGSVNTASSGDLSSDQLSVT